MRFRTCIAVTTLALASAFASSCARTAKPRGQLMIAIDTDMAPPGDFDRLEIFVVEPSRPDEKPSVLYKEIGTPGLVTFPATRAVVGNDVPATKVLVRVVTGDGRNRKGVTPTSPTVGDAKTLHEVLTTVPAEGIALLRIHIDWLCYGMVEVQPADGYVEGKCPENFTCRAGACVDWTVDSSTLPVYEESAVFGGGSAKGDGDCFDTVSCFSRGSISAIDLDKCTVATPAAETGLNVAIVLPSGGPGICGREACYVPLLPSKDAGWTESGGRITVPPATCARIKTGAALGVAVTTACRTRSESVPTCGAWSSVTSEPGTKDAGPPDGFVSPEAGPDAGAAD